MNGPPSTPRPPGEPGARPWLWMGPVVDERELLAGVAHSPAANRWQLGLLRALSGSGVPLRVLSYQPDRAFPRGPLWKAGSAASPLADLDVSTVGYLNAPALRQGSLGRAHRRAAHRLISDGAAPAAVLTYNAPAGPAAAALELQRRHGIPWIAVVADVDGITRKADVDAYLNRVEQAAGRVVLSWGLFQRIAREPRMHLDGGVTRIRPAPDEPPSRAVLYAGMLGRHGGIDLLLEAFRAVPDPAAELWICGKLPGEAFLRRVAGDPRARYLGAVPEAELERLSERASVFVNPRPVGIRESDFNFPSKVLEYLSYGKPVVSTWTPGLAPEYRDLLLVAEEASPHSLARKLEEALAWSPAQRAARRALVERFLREERLWSVQALRLRRFVSSLLDG